MLKKNLFGVLTLLVGVMLVFGFAACDNGGGDNNNNNDNDGTLWPSDLVTPNVPAYPGYTEFSTSNTGPFIMLTNANLFASSTLGYQSDRGSRGVQFDLVSISGKTIKVKCT